MTTATATLNEVPLPKPEGLEGVVAASTALSHVFGEEGRLVYRGYDIHELAGKASFEEVAHLLWLGHLPTASELSQFQAKLEANRNLPAAVIDVLRLIPAETAPMDALRTGLSALGAIEPWEIVLSMAFMVASIWFLFVVGALAVSTSAYAQTEAETIERALAHFDGRIALEDLRTLIDGSGFDDSGSGLDQVNVH